MVEPFSVLDFTAEVESEFAMEQPADDPMQEFEDECLRSFGFTDDLVSLDDFDDDGTVVYDDRDDPDAGTGKIVVRARLMHMPLNLVTFTNPIGTPNSSTQVLESELTIFLRGTASEILDPCFE